MGPVESQGSVEERGRRVRVNEDTITEAAIRAMCFQRDREQRQAMVRKQILL